jgi:hypothetical protein
MNIIKKSAALLSMAIAFSATSTVVLAEEAASTSAPAASVSTVISLIEKGLAEVAKSDFSAAQVQLKAARNASDAIVGQSEAAKKAHASLMQGQIKSKKGDVAAATEELNKAIALYKAL